MLLTASCARSLEPEQALATANGLAAQGDLDGAIRVLEKSLAANTEDRDLRLQAARLYLRKGDFATGEALLRRLVDQGAPPELWFTDLGEAQLAQQKYFEALELSKSITPATPTLQAQHGLLALRAQLGLPNRDERGLVRAVAEFKRLRDTAAAGEGSEAALAHIDETLGALRQSEPLVRGGLEHFECARAPTAQAASATTADLPAPKRVLRVGPGQRYQTIAAAADAARDGDLIEIAAGDYVGDVAHWTQTDLTLRGVGGRPHLKAAGRHSQGKAIWVISGDNVLVENIEFSGARVPNQNGAGIRFEGRRLTVRNSHFHDNENGILTSNRGDAEVVIEFSEFARNGFGDGYTHNMYIGHSASFVLRGSYSHDVRVGHLVKSRAEVNQILYNRLTDEEAGSSSYNLDLPNGGRALVLGNVMQQGSRTENPAMVAFAAESPGGSADRLYMAFNTLYNVWFEGIFVDNKSAAPALLVDNIFAGAPAQILRGPGETLGYVAASRVALADPRVAGFQLGPDSFAIDAAVDPPQVPGWDLEPAFEYVHPASVRARPVIHLRDVGALEFCGW
ncbi:MAG TPA: tetratricopeptide repeat protein [Steroidobacteraceae bacterium]|nr:tetratricopeptide repeat protein [Steroidobacteraceae bacterium]